MSHSEWRQRLWSVDRWGRLLAGSSLLALTALTAWQPIWLWGILIVAAHLTISSLSDRCPIHALLIRLGAREREDLFAAGMAGPTRLVGRS